jgi:CRP-like cAMP-binding protein
VKNFNWKELLGQHSLFKALDPKEVERIIAQLLDDKVSEEREYSEGKIIFREGDSGATVFLVGLGSVQVILEGGGGGSGTPVSTLKQGEFFGEMALLEKKPRAATVKAKENCVLLEISGQEFLKLLDEHKDVESKMLLKLSERLRQANEQVLAVRVRGVDDKLERFNERVEAELKKIDASVAKTQAMTDHTKARADDIIQSFERTRSWLTWILYFVITILTLGGMVGGGVGYWYFKEIDRLFDKAKTSVSQIETFDTEIKKIRNDIAANLVVPSFRDALKKGDIADAVKVYEQFQNVQPGTFFEPLYEIQQAMVNDKPPKDYSQLIAKILQDAKTSDKAADVTQAYYVLLANQILAKDEIFLNSGEFKTTFTALAKHMKDNKDRVNIKDIPTLAIQSFPEIRKVKLEKLRDLNRVLGRS